MKPAAEWDVIANEAATVPGLFTGYACILAAIPPLATIVSTAVFAHGAIVIALIAAVLSYIVSLLGVFIIHFIINALAPSFGATSNGVQAMKLVVYAYTASWVAGIGNLIPVLGLLIVLAGSIYSLYLMYIGLPKLMHCPPDKTMVYFIVSLVVAVVVYMVLGMIVGMIMLSVTLALAGAVAVGAAGLAGSGIH
jgi:hypothetical protein